MKLPLPQDVHALNRLTLAALAGSACALSLASAASAAPGKSPASDAQLRATWRAAIAETPVPEEGCFQAAYPSVSWVRTACVTAPKRPYIPLNGRRTANTVGDGNDYQAIVTGLISSGVGSFPVVKGLKSETGYGGKANTYSLQLNSEFFKSPVCSGATNPASCLGWEQFVYSNSGVAFMQYWLINYGNTCPTGGWMAFSGDCYKNSAAVRVPTQVITQLPNLEVTGKATKSTDTMIMTTADGAYTTTGKDSVVDLAGYWNGSEFNIVGDGGGSNANFNSGTSLTVKIAYKDGLTAAPTCKPDDGTTGETNNLTLGACTPAAGARPSVKFIEKN